MPNALSASRLVLSALIVWLALTGSSRLAGVALIAAGVTDFLDGYLARRSGKQSAIGAHLDAVADATLLVSGAAALEILHPEIVRENAALLAAAALVYPGSLAAGVIAFRCLVDPSRLSAKIAGGLLYAFAAVTLLSAVYEPLLLKLAVLALAVSSVEGIVSAVRRSRAAGQTIHTSGSANRQRSQAPQASNGVACSASPITSKANSKTPTRNEIRP